MPHHTWGDDWPYWQELYAAETWVGDYVYKWSRCRLVSKEKYGTIRYEFILPPDGRVCNVSWVYKKWTTFGCFILHKAIKKAYIKFPNVAEELSCDLYWCDL